MASQIEAKNGKQAMLTDIYNIIICNKIVVLYMELVYASFDLGQRIPIASPNVA